MISTHIAIINSLKSMDLKFDRDGVCAGIAELGKNMILARDFEVFNRRIDIISDIEKRNGKLVDEIDSVKSKIITLIPSAKEYVINQLNGESLSLFERFTSTQSNQEDQFNHFMTFLKLNNKDNLIKDIRGALQDKINSFLTRNERDIIDVQIFLENVSLNFCPREYSHLNSEDSKNYGQDTAQSSLLSMPINLEKTGGIKNLKSLSTTGIYNLDELTIYFQTLRDTMDKLTDPVALKLMSSNHAISVGYDPIEKVFIWIDANNLPAQKVADAGAIAKMVNKSFSAIEPELDDENEDKIHSPYTAFVAEVSIATNNFPSHDPRVTIMADWHKSEEWKNIHEVTSEKACLVDAYGANWLSMASDSGDVRTMIKLLALPNVDPNKADDNGNTPLHIASFNGRLDSIRELLKSPDINPNAKNNDDKTPLYFACENRSAEIVYELLQIQSINLSCGHPYDTPYGVAKGNDDKDIIFLFKLHNQKSEIENNGESDDENRLNAIDKLQKLVLKVNKNDTIAFDKLDEAFEEIRWNGKYNPLIDTIEKHIATSAEQHSRQPTARQQDEALTKYIANKANELNHPVKKDDEVTEKPDITTPSPRGLGH